MVIFDTNVLLLNYKNLVHVDDDIIIPITVIKELDKHKTDISEVGYHARNSIKVIDEAIENNYKINGYDLIIDSDEYVNFMNNDDRILQTCIKYPDSIFMTNDLSLKIKAISKNINAVKFTHCKVIETPGKIHNIETEKRVLDIINSEGYIDERVIDTNYLAQNTCYILKDNYSSSSILARKIQNKIVKINPPKYVSGIEPRNVGQRFYADMLLDEKIKIVLVSGVSGSSKTLMALACGLHLVNSKSKINRVMCCKSVYEVGKEIGFLPGDLSTKIQPFYEAFNDNLSFIAHKLKRDDYYDKGVTEIEYQHLSSIRGRTFVNTLMILDECFPYKQDILTDIGKIPIGTLYNLYIKGEKLPNAMTFNIQTQEYEYKPIISASYKGVKPLVEVKCGIKKIKCTENHPFLTTKGWKPAGDLTKDDYLTIKSNNIHNSRWLNDDQQQVVIGSWLGDGHLQHISHGSYRLTIIHSEQQIDYLTYKASIFQRENNIKYIKTNGYAQTPANRFTTLSFGLPYQLDDKKNIECEEWILDNIDERGLAVWFMDDGSVNTEFNGARLHTEFFSETGNINIMKMLKNRFNMEGTLRSYIKKEKTYFYIYLPKESYIKLCQTIAPYVHPNLSYKILNYELLNGGAYKWNNQYCNYTVNKVKEVVKLEQSTDVFDIEVADNHNFIACYRNNIKTNTCGFIVHNCQNESPTSVKTFISRAGINSKVVICGDLAQIDNKQNTKYDNGLFHAQTRLYDNPMVGIISLSKTERSDIAEIANLL